jgi:hypothetical protein
MVRLGNRSPAHAPLLQVVRDCFAHELRRVAMLFVGRSLHLVQQVRWHQSVSGALRSHTIEGSIRGWRVKDQVRAPGSYARNDAGDAGIDAALLSKAVGRPVRVQGMRYEGHGCDPKGPASIHRARAALDQDGAVVGYAFESKGF